MTNHCVSCRWWEPHVPKYEGFCRLRHVDGLITEFYQIQPRDSIDLGNGTRQIAPACWAKHDEVRTSPDFGCNQWEKRA